MLLLIRCVVVVMASVPATLEPMAPGFAWGVVSMCDVTDAPVYLLPGCEVLGCA